MENEDKLIKNLISFLSQKNLIDRFQEVFNDVIREDEIFQENLEKMVKFYEKPEDEILWKRILEAEDSLMKEETKTLVFVRFEETLKEIFSTAKSKSNA